MQVQELNDTEREVFLALLAHLAEADARIHPGEVMEIDDLADEMGITNIRERLMRARGGTQTRADLLSALQRVTRTEARTLIQGVLSNLAQSDGERTPSESELLDAVAAVWRG